MFYTSKTQIQLWSVTRGTLSVTSVRKARGISWAPQATVSCRKKINCAFIVTPACRGICYRWVVFRRCRGIPSAGQYGTATSKGRKPTTQPRGLALSPQLVSLLWEQIARQKARGHEFLFSSQSGAPWDMKVFRARKLRPLLTSLGITLAGFHAFRHFNVSLLDTLRIPLKVIQERAGHALTGSFNLDVWRQTGMGQKP